MATEGGNPIRLIDCDRCSLRVEVRSVDEKVSKVETRLDTWDSRMVKFWVGLSAMLLTTLGNIIALLFYSAKPDSAAIAAEVVKAISKAGPVGN